MFEAMSAEEALRYAKRVALNMCRDPEMESIAGSSAWRAILAFDGSRPFKSFLRVVVRKDVWCYWRREAKRREELKSAVWWENEGPAVYQQTTLDISDPAWRLLVCYYMERWPLDVVAKRMSCTKKEAKGYIAQAVEELKEAVDG